MIAMKLSAIIIIYQTNGFNASLFLYILSGYIATSYDLNERFNTSLI